MGADRHVGRLVVGRHSSREVQADQDSHRAVGDAGGDALRHGGINADGHISLAKSGGTDTTFYGLTVSYPAANP